MVIFALLCSSINFLNNTYAKERSIDESDLSAKAAVLIDGENGRILFGKNEKEKRAMASTTKIMTCIVALENCKANQVVEISSKAASMPKVKMNVMKGEQYYLKDLLYAMMLESYNDVAVAVAESIGGNIENFAKMMNEKAKALKLKNTHFVNCTGLHDKNHYTCAKDLSTMAAYLLQIGGKKLLAVTSLYDSYVREKTKQKFWLVNTNKLLKQYPGVDGLKTGFTKEAGYCIVTTCKEKDLRLIGVVMNEDKPQTRNEDMKGLLNFGFSKYQQVKLYQKGEVIDTVKVKDMVEQKINVVSHKNLYYLSEKTNQEKFKKKIVFDSLQLPINQNKSIGKLILYNKDKAVASYPLYSEINVKKMSFLDKLLRVYKSLI